MRVGDSRRPMAREDYGIKGIANAHRGDLRGWRAFGSVCNQAQSKPRPQSGERRGGIRVERDTRRVVAVGLDHSCEELCIVRKAPLVKHLVEDASPMLRVEQVLHFGFGCAWVAKRRHECLRDGRKTAEGERALGVECVVEVEDDGFDTWPALRGSGLWERQSLIDVDCWSWCHQSVCGFAIAFALFVSRIELHLQCVQRGGSAWD